MDPKTLVLKSPRTNSIKSSKTLITLESKLLSLLLNYKNFIKSNQATNTYNKTTFLFIYIMSFNLKITKEDT
jgi:hypothetical protein